MALYTRTGDKGFTLLPGPDGEGPLRVRKDDPRLVALGEVDALNSAVGLAHAETVRVGNDRIRKFLATVQEDLLRVGAVLSGVIAGRRMPVRLGQAAVTRLEKHIDAIWTELPELTHFILPSGCELACRLHMARVAGRQTERAIVTALNLADRSPAKDAPASVLVRYVNRLSDFLFALARLANRDAGIADRLWRGKK